MTLISEIIQTRPNQGLKRPKTCNPGNPNGIVIGGERDGNLLRLETIDAATNPRVGVGQIDGVAAETGVERGGDGLERAVQGGGNSSLDGPEMAEQSQARKHSESRAPPAKRHA